MAAGWSSTRSTAGQKGFVWNFASLFATFAPKAWRPRLAAWLEQPVMAVPWPLPLSEAELGAIRTPFYLVMGKRSLLLHPKRQLERVPRLIPGARAEIVAATGHGPQIDHPDLLNARMLSFMEDIDSLDPAAARGATGA